MTRFNMRFNMRFAVTFTGTSIRPDQTLRRHTKTKTVLAESSHDAIEKAMDMVGKTPHLKELYYPTYTCKCLEN